MHYPEQLLWVPMQKPADIKNVKTMQKIRSHAQREVRRRERESKPKRLAESSKMSRALHIDVVSVGTDNQAMSEGESPKSQDDLSILPKVAHLSQDTLTDALDDLNPYAESILLQPLRLHQMIYRCISVWNSEQACRVCGGGPNGRWQLWMPSLVTNETVLYAQSFSAILTYQLWTRRVYAPEALMLKDQAVTRINRSLSESTDAVSDATLASVLCLAFSTHLEKNRGKPIGSLLGEVFMLGEPHNGVPPLSASRHIGSESDYFRLYTAKLSSMIQGLGGANYLTHMNGLKRMIELKGGWFSVCSNELLGEILTMCDYLGAIINRSKLILIPTDRPLAQKAPQISPIFSQTSPLLDLIDSSQTPSFAELDQGTSQIIETMRRLTRAFSDQNKNSSLDHQSLHDGLPCCTQDLCTPEQAMLTCTVEERMSQALRMTSRIYALALVHDVPFANPSNRSALRILQRMLESTILVGWTNLPGALLWVLLVGAAAERGQGEGNILTAYLSTTCTYMGFRHWDAVREILVRFLAIEDQLDARAGTQARGEDDPLDMALP